MKRNIYFFIRFSACFLLLFMPMASLFASERKDSLSPDPIDSVEVYLLTCEPHDEVYSLYGHTAIRVVDKMNHQDIAANWGVFDSTSKNFVLRFTFGLTDYMLGIFPMNMVMDEYSFYGSRIYEQHINFTADEKRRFIAALQENAKRENQIYRYNYFYDNCTSRARDILIRSIDGSVNYTPTYLQQGDRSLRQLIHMKNEDHPWYRFGNDILLGVGCDANADHPTRQFLPEILMNDFDSATIVAKDGSTRKLVDRKNVYLPKNPPYKDNTLDFPFSPTQCAIAYCCVILALLLAEIFTRRSLAWVKYPLMLIYPTLGLLLFIMIFSKHPTVSVNLQILICNPLMFWLLFPKARWRYRHHTVAVLCLLFFLGNIVQTYAEGMNIMALALFLYSAKGIIVPDKKN